MGRRRRSHFGWGYDDARPSGTSLDKIAAVLSERFATPLTAGRPVPLGDVELRAPRVAAPPSLAAIAVATDYERCLHHYGRSFRDVVRGARGEFPDPPDVVCYPRDDTEVAAVLEWAADDRLAVIPFGGGSSVSGGVETSVGEGFAGVVSLDTTAMSGVIEIDHRSEAARIAGGTFGPDLEAALGAEGLTLRHFPQSFEFSTLGGWLATRSGGHFATRYTHIDDLVASIRAVTPAGPIESRRLPGSGAGPSPDRLLLGSEGSLGVITEAWMRVRPRPTHRARAELHFADFPAAVSSVRALSQSGLEPANCRLLDAGEAATAGAGDGTTCVLLLGFESAHFDVAALLDLALDLLAGGGGEVRGRAVSVPPAATGRPDAGAARPAGPAGSEAWRSSFLAAPYLRDAIALCGGICETCETAITWDRFEALHAAVTAAARSAFDEATGGKGTVSCRFTHVYPDGPAPYFTFIAPGREGRQLEQWAVIKRAVSEALLASGGTITHHHAVGRDHLEWYRRQRPPLYGDVLAAAKSVLDPAGCLNPGVMAGG